MSIQSRPADRTAFARGIGRALTVLIPLVSLLAVSACAPEAGEEGESSAAADSAAADPQGATALPTDTAAMRERMALVAELRSIDQALQPIRAKVLQGSPELQARQGELVDQVQAAMAEIDPGVEDDMARFDSLRMEYGAAQRAGEQEKLQSLAGELQTLQASLQQTQGEALAQEDVAAAIEEFRGDLEDQMREADPRADSLLDRAGELRERLGMAPSDG